MDIRADIYSLGCTLYHLLAGKPPFAGGSGYSKVAGHLERTPTPLPQVRADLPLALLEVVGRMLAKDPKRRFQTPAEVADALAPFAAGESSRSGRRRMTRRRWMVAATTAGVGMLGSWFVWRNRGVPQAKEILRLEGHTAAVQNVALCPDGQFALSGSEDRTMRLWSLETGQSVRQFEGHEQLVSRVRFLPDGQRAVSASYDQTLRLWNLDTGKEERRFVGANSIISNLTVSPDGRLMLSTGGPVVLLWDVRSGRIARRLGNDDRGGHYVQFFSNGRRAISAGADRMVHLWNLDTGEELAALGEHSHAIEAGGLSADERNFLAGCYDKTAWLWDLTSRQELRRLSFPHRVYRVVSTPAGFWVACNDDQGGISVWDVNTGRELCRIEGHQAAVWGLEFSPDRRLALTGSRDKTLRVWELPGELA